MRTDCRSRGPNRHTDIQRWNPHSEPHAYPPPHTATHTTASTPTQQDTRTQRVGHNVRSCATQTPQQTREAKQTAESKSTAEAERQTRPRQSLAPTNGSHTARNACPPSRRRRKVQGTAPGHARLDAPPPGTSHVPQKVPSMAPRKPRACPKEALRSTGRARRPPSTVLPGPTAASPSPPPTTSSSSQLPNVPPPHMASKFSPQQRASSRPKHTYTCHDDGKRSNAPAAARCTNTAAAPDAESTPRQNGRLPSNSGSPQHTAHRPSHPPGGESGGGNHRKPLQRKGTRLGRDGRDGVGTAGCQRSAEQRWKGAHKVATRAATGHPTPVPSHHRGGRRGRARGPPPHHTHPHRPTTPPPPHPPTRQGAPPSDGGKHTGKGYQWGSTPSEPATADVPAPAAAAAVRPTPPHPWIHRRPEPSTRRSDDRETHSLPSSRAKRECARRRHHRLGVSPARATPNGPGTQPTSTARSTRRRRGGGPTRGGCPAGEEGTQSAPGAE